MEQRLRPITYAETLEAKKIAEENDKQIIEQPTPTIPQGKDRPTSINEMVVDDLPSGGESYPDHSEIYYSPLTFGEMKFLSVSTMTDTESVNFFLTKIHCSFPKENLTYYDFYYLSTLIKLATFGEMEFVMNFECVSCGAEQKAPFSIQDFIFEEIRVPLPITVDLESPHVAENGVEVAKVNFGPITIGGFRKMILDGTREDQDIYMSNCIIDELSDKDKIEIIKTHFTGLNVSLLETIDISLFHGVQDLTFSCKNRIGATEESTGEVCGRIHDIPFQDIVEYVSATDKSKNALRERINFGVQNGNDAH